MASGQQEGISKQKGKEEERKGLIKDRVSTAALLRNGRKTDDALIVQIDHGGVQEKCPRKGKVQ